MAQIAFSRPISRTQRRGKPGFWQFLVNLTALRRARTRLDGLDNHLLNDVGLSREQAESEAKRPFWDVPDHWKN